MQWLTPTTALLAGAVAIPLLLLLYFLKLKRQEKIISSTLLWKRAIQDLQVNAPFQKLRRNILLLLQLLAILAILFALAGPVVSLFSGPSQRYVILIDRSASMNAREENSPAADGTTRLDTARDQAKKFIQSLRSKAAFSLQDNSDQAMIITFADHSKIMCNFTSDKRQLIKAVDAITGSDGGTSLSEVVQAARAFAQSPGVETNNRSAEIPAQLVLFSDGNIRDLDQISITTGADNSSQSELVFHRIGSTFSDDKTDSGNIAITAMQAQRSYENPEEITVFATLANYGSRDVTCDVQLSINDSVLAIKSIAIPPGQITPAEPSLQATGNSPAAANDTSPGKTSVNFTLSYTEAGILEVRQLQTDLLASDDAAWSILSSPKKLSVLLVTSGNMILESALGACPLARLDIQTPAQFDSSDMMLSGVLSPYDVIVLDQHVPEQLGRGRYLIFGPPPVNIEVTGGEVLQNQYIIDWRVQHPVLRYVNLNNLFAARCQKLSLPRDAEVLAEFNETPALALLHRKGSVFLLAGFDVMQTNWPFEPGFVMFCYNAISFLGMQTSQGQPMDLHVGQPIIIEGVAGETSARLNGPNIADEVIKPNDTGTIRFARTDLTGIYNLRIPDQPEKYFAVNLLDSRESNIQSRSEISLSGKTVRAQTLPVRRTNLPIWPYLVVAALLLACLEWIVYIKKVQI